MKYVLIFGCMFVSTITGLAVAGIFNRENVKLAFYSRVPLSAALGLGFIGPIAIATPLTHMMGNAFLAFGIWQLVLTTAICILAAFLFTSIYRNIEYNGRERFLDIPLDLNQAKLASDPVTLATRLKRTTKPRVDVETDLSMTSHHSEGSILVRAVDYLRRLFFEEPAVPHCWGRLRTRWHIAFALLIGLSSPLCVLKHSIGQDAWKAGWLLGLGAIGGGFLLACVFVLLSTYLSNKFAPTTLQIPGMNGLDMAGLIGKTTPSKTAMKIGKLWARLTQGPGYSSPDPADPASYITHPGHVQLTISTVVMALLYLIVFLSSSLVAPISNPENALPTVAYVVFVVSFLTSIFAFLTFLLDYYHVPTTLAFATFLILIYSLPTHDPASFEAIRTEAATSAPPELAEMLSKRITLADEAWPVLTQPKVAGAPGRRERVMIVVTAPGGGIHAAAWTARVLKGLHDLYGAAFDDSLGLISGISGGGMGGWVYVDALARETPDAMLDVDEIAQASSLDAVAWGFAFPDLVRAVNPLPWSPDDRGHVLENTWERRLENWDSATANSRCRTLGELGAKARDGKIPLIAWTTTDVVTGKRVVISPVRDGVGPPETTINLYNELRQLGDDDHSFDLNAATATRLAATFPYVTPIVGLDRSVLTGHTSESAKTLSQLRCIDGGYFDNEGLVTAINCIRSFLTKLGESDGKLPPIDKILLVRIEPSPMVPTDAAEAQALADNSGLDLVMSGLGPLFALANVRSASQAERGDLEALLLVTALTEGANQSALQTEKLRKSWGLSNEDIELLLSADWKKELFDTELTVDGLERGHRIISAAIGIGESANRKMEDNLHESFLPPTSTHSADIVAALNLWNQNDDNEVVPQEIREDQLSRIVEGFRELSRGERVRQIRVEQMTIPYLQPREVDGHAGTSQSPSPPLSWALSPREVENYEKAWADLVNRKSRVPKTKDGNVTNSATEEISVTERDFLHQLDQIFFRIADRKTP